MHLGAKPDAGEKYSESRGTELWDTFAGVIGVCEQEQTDLLLIAGDLFHRQPLLRELKEVDYLFSTLTRTKVVLIAGNHDYIRRNSYYRTFQWSSNVYPLFGEEMQSVELKELATCVYGFSYYSREITKPRYAEARAQGRQKYEILLAHGGDERHIPVKKNELLALGYDYIAMGHIHKPGMIEENRIVYPGALEPVDSNDTGVHGYISGEIRNDSITVKFVPFASRQYIHMKLDVNETMTNAEVRALVRAEIERRGVQNIYKIILSGTRDRDTVFAVGHMDAFGNVLEVSDETKPAYHFAELEEKNRSNLLGAYIRSFGDCEPDSVEYMALYEGVEALLETKRG